MSGKRKDANMIFLEAIEKPSAKERTAYLDEACRDDPGLREELESLLEAHENAGGFLKSPLLDLDVTLDTSPITEGPGTTIGNYKLLEQIGEGGMAVVYMAEQKKPIRRRVALKIIKLGMDTKQVIARFEVERQALAVMDHPNIAKVFDAGSTETGRPYFVMELVRGVSISKYCDKNKLTTEDRLDLFIQVCNAVQHAHQKGIIHRDIKPSNVMVTLHDGKPVPKVIDFGIAKATSQRLTEKTLFTRYAQMIGTPAYMSPEQAEMSGLDIDTRADIYSLGILLYELLTGVTPFSEEQLREAGYLEMQRIICEQEPVKPSTRLSTLGDTLTDVAEHRKASPDLLQKLVRGDLDWIVMKSLEKDRTHRYNAATEMVADIARHINHEPVLAGPPSQIYRLRKFIRRHRTHAIGAAIVAVLLAGMTVISAMYIQAHNRGEEAEFLKHKDILSKAMEFRSRGQFQDAMNKVETMLSSKHVGAEARLLRARLILELHGPTDAVKELEELIKERDEIACQAHLLLARIYLESDPGDPRTTKQYQQKAKGHKQKGEKLFSESADAYCLRAMTAGTVQETLVLLNKAIELDRSHYTSLEVRALTYYALRDYRNMERDAVAMTTLRDWDSLGYSLMAIALRQTEYFADAIKYHNDAIRISPDNPELYDERRQTYMQMGNYERALSDAQECVQLQPNENIYHFHVFFSLAALGRYEDAKAKYATIAEADPKAKIQFDRWAMREVFNILGAGQRLDLPEHKTGGVAFWPLHEAVNYYRELSAKGERLVTRGFRAAWSPDGTELAYSRGFPGANGIEILHLESRKTRLLTIPGKDPVWSPDGTYIAFVRERQVQNLAEITGESDTKPVAYSQEEIWIIEPNGEELRRLAKGGFPTWSNDSRRVFYQSRLESKLLSVTVDDPNAQPKSIMRCTYYYPAVSPDARYVAYAAGRSLQIVELASGSRVASWSAPLGSRGLVTSWSPNGRELSVGGFDRSKLGLWIYELDSKKATKVLNGPVTLAAWSPDGNHIAFDLREPYFEIWSAELKSDMSTIEALGPGRTLEGHYQDLFDQYTRVIKSDPDNSEAYHQRAHLHESLEQWREAVKDFTRALEGKPDDIHLYEERADVYLRLQEYEKAAADLEQCAKFLESGGHPTQASMNELVDSMNELAWLLATSPKAELRNGTRAIEIATKACELTDCKNRRYMYTLAASYAEAGDFDEAIKWQQKANYTLDGTDPRVPVAMSSPGGAVIILPEDAGKRFLIPTGGVAASKGTILAEYWFGIGGRAVSNLTSSAKFPHSPSQIEQLTWFEIPTGWNDNYGTRVRGYLHPPASGSYTFWIASDDASELWLSTDATKTNAVLICRVDGWCQSRDWDNQTETNNPNQRSAPISLAAGRKYYIEALQKEDTGGDHLSVAWQGPGISRRVIEGKHLSPGGIGWVTPNFQDGAWAIGAGGVGYDRETGYGDFIGADVEAEMYNSNSTCYIRIPFVVMNTELTDLRLNMRYDDGFIAYLNGAEVLRVNFDAGAIPEWNSAASASHDDAAAVIFESFDISDFANLLRSGLNLLAIHGLNTSKTDSDFIISAELVAHQVSQGDIAPTAMEKPK